MIPPLFEWVKADAVCVSFLGAAPVRFWPFRSAPQPGQPGHGHPYAVWQLVYGAPANYMNQRPDSDNPGVQIDAYATTASEARAVSDALKFALETHGHVVSYNGEDRDIETGLYRAGFTAEFWTDR